MKSILSVILVLAAATVADAQCGVGGCGVGRQMFSGARRFSTPTPLFSGRSLSPIFQGVPTYYTPSYRVVVPRQSYRVVVPRQTYRFMSPVRSISCASCH